MERPAAVRVARVYDPPGPDDGARVLVDPQEAALTYDSAVLHYRGGIGFLNLLAPGNG